jgi:O-antigen chain-terminating methyltransferase
MIHRHGPDLVEDRPVPATAELERCLNRVEYYQPLYGISGFEGPLRSCRDRALAIEGALAPLGRGFRLIDFGSSLGYFPFFFADRGAVATGVDIKPENTAVALAAQRLNGLSATFKTAPLDLDTAAGIGLGEYDAALMLSVLHHITHQHGGDYAARLVARVLARIPTLVLELAHRDEAVRFAWRNSLPDDPLAVLSACPDIQVRALDHFPSHLSAARRPMYLVTRRRSGIRSLLSMVGAAERVADDDILPTHEM